ncbi:MAG: hypothetical protein IKB99_02740 [Lentisphaeria bacterium]|nr:hypothetical protein [Lentisphaeria bacterium]
MKSSLRIGYWEHWFKLDYHIGTFLKEKFNCNVEKVDFSQKNYYDTVDVLIISQSGVNDYLENDRDRLHDYVRNGGICWIMHQDWRRYNPCFLPEEAGRPLLVHRYCATLGGKHASMTYLQPWIEDAGKGLFGVPNQITPDEMVYWELDADSFDAVHMNEAPTRVRTAATGALTNVEKWEVFGSFMDAGMPENSALVMQMKYGKGLFLWNQILFPELRLDENDRVMEFWERYCENALHYFDSFIKGETVTAPAAPAKNISAGNSWKKTITHLHTLDWYAADHTLADLNAAMRFLKFDAAVLGFKDALSYHDAPDYEKYSDDKVTLLPGMEYHPFNFQHPTSQNAYHMLALGVRSCYNRFTRSLFDDADVDEYITTALEHIKKEGGASCATHPDDEYWRKYDFDAVDIYDWDISRRGPERIESKPFSENAVQKAWMEGSHITLMASVDMWGVTRLRNNPVCNFICYQGDITRENLVKAVKAGHVMPSFGIHSAAVTLGEFLPGDTIPVSALAQGIKCSFSAPEELTELRLWAGDKIVLSETLPAGTTALERTIEVAQYTAAPYLHLELRGKNSHLISNPFFLS